MDKLKFGVFADPQYCDCNTTLNRYYRRSLMKLNECINYFNSKNDIEFIVGLGDLIDKDFESFSPVNEVLKLSVKKVYLIAGNHDLAVEPDKYDDVYNILIPAGKRYYSFTKGNWHFIFLDGNDITWHSTDDFVLKQAREMTSALEKEGKPNYHEFNGGIGTEQIKWLENQLIYAGEKNLKSVVVCHYPLLPSSRYTLWNDSQIIEILEKYKVQLWLNGHHHDGSHEYKNGVHYLTMKGMADTEHDNSFAEISLSDNKITVTGFGREEYRVLKLV